MPRYRDTGRWGKAGLGPRTKAGLSLVLNYLWLMKLDSYCTGRHGELVKLLNRGESIV